jgi:hypothetical protein
MGTVLYGCANQGEVSAAQASRENTGSLHQAAPLLVTQKQRTGPVQQWGKDARFLELLPELQELEAR